MRNFSIDLDDDEINKSFLNKKFWKILSYVAATLILLAFIYTAKNAYKYNTFPTDINEIPLYKTELTPYRLKPVDPGGEIFENQDKLVYNNLIEKKQSIPSKSKANVKQNSKPKKVNKSKNLFDLIEE